MIKAGFDRRIKVRGTINKEVINKDNISKDNISKDNISKDNISKDSISKDNINKDSINKDKVINKDKARDVVEEEKEEDHAQDVKVVSEIKEEKEEEKEEDNDKAVMVVSEKEAVVVEDVVEMVVSIDLKIIKIVSSIKEDRTSLANKSNVVENTIENLGNLLKTFLTVMSQISQKWNKNLKIGIPNRLHLPIPERRGLVLRLKMLQLLKFSGMR
jgi:pentapeptide MXKDX repeat protein